MLPQVEKVPVLLIRWTEKALASNVIPMVKKHLEQGSLIMLPNPAHDILLLTASQQSLEEQAHQTHLVKRRIISTDQVIMDHFTVEHRAQFKIAAPGRDSHGIFTVHERSQLTMGILDRISIKNDTILTNMLLDDSRKHKVTGLRYILQSQKWIDVLTPLHVDEQKVRIQKDTWYPLWRIMPPIEDIQDYYGPPVAYYFAFMGCLGRWLGILGTLGFFTFLFRIYRKDNIDEDEFTPFYGVFCFLWAVLFARFWERQEHTLSYVWGTLQITNLIDDFQRDFSFVDGSGRRRPEFRGFLRRSPITGLPEEYYPPIRRKFKYFVSALVTALMLGVAFWVMILSLNLQGYIVPKTRYHPFHFPYLAKLAEEGQLFDVASDWVCYVPVLLHVVCIFLMNNFYRGVAKTLTDWENHKTQDAYDNSLILKRFLFEAFDCYIVLFYLAFYERDVHRLRMELVAVFNVDSFRRLFMEIIIPLAIHSRDSRDKEHPQDLHLDEYEAFDDYMEILIQFGYVTLFASAYPLASLVMYAAVWIEIRSDCYKLTFLCQKPLAERVADIGMWKALLQSMVWLSCLTNCLLFGFSSEQMMHYLPGFYSEAEDGTSDFVHDKGCIAIFVIFGLERILIFFGLSLYAMIPAFPEDLIVEMQRRRFLLSSLHEKTM